MNKDIDAILEIQTKYLISNLPAANRSEGFVTTPFTVNQIKQIISEDGLFIAKNSDKIIAYVYAGSWTYFSQWPIFPYMTSRFSNLMFNGLTISTTNSFQYGPICIEKEFRGTGLLEEIFEFMRLEFKEKYPLSITFINQINQRSIKAHTEKLNWKIIKEFEFNGNIFYMLAYDMEKSVFKKSN